MFMEVQLCTLLLFLEIMCVIESPVPWDPGMVHCALMPVCSTDLPFIIPVAGSLPMPLTHLFLAGSNYCSDLSVESNQPISSIRSSGEVHPFLRLLFGEFSHQRGGFPQAMVNRSVTVCLSHTRFRCTPTWGKFTLAGDKTLNFQESNQILIMSYLYSLFAGLDQFQQHFQVAFPPSGPPTPLPTPSAVLATSSLWLPPSPWYSGDLSSCRRFLKMCGLHFKLHPHNFPWTRVAYIN